MKNLKQIRLQQGYTQKQIGEVVDKSAQTILFWENQIYNPTIKDAIKLANFFHCSLDYLVGRKVELYTIKDLCAAIEKIDYDSFLQFIIDNLKTKL